MSERVSECVCGSATSGVRVKVFLEWPSALSRLSMRHLLAFVSEGPSRNSFLASSPLLPLFILLTQAGVVVGFFLLHIFYLCLQSTLSFLFVLLPGLG